MYLWCGYCRQSTLGAEVHPGHFSECPTCRGRLRPFDGSSTQRHGVDAMPPIVRAAAQYPDRHLGRFVLVRELGQGAMGTVQQAWDTQERRWVALKLLKPEVADERGLERLRDEADATGSLNHPNIAPVYEVLELDGRIALVMKYVDGRTLHEIFLHERREPAAIDVAVKHVRDAGLGLGYAHKHGLVHRDVKPANLMVDADGRVYVLDFGVANALAEWGNVAGATAYMAPEQAMGLTRRVDSRTDVFSLGVTLWTLLAGRRPFKGRNDAEVAKAIIRESTPSIRQLRPDVPESVDAALQKAMEKDRNLRYPTGAEFAADLNEALISLEDVQENWGLVETGAPLPPTVTVLLIEDDESLAGLVGKFLRRERMEVVHIADGAEALACVKEAVPDFVILDLNLPGKSGWEILRQLRSMTSYNHVPIMIITGAGGEGGEVRGFQLGADDYIEKPFSLGVLRARIRKLLQQHHVSR